MLILKWSSADVCTSHERRKSLFTQRFVEDHWKTLLVEFHHAIFIVLAFFSLHHLFPCTFYVIGARQQISQFVADFTMFAGTDVWTCNIDV